MKASLVDLKERVALADGFTPEERAFILDAINAAAAAAPVMVDSGNYLGRIETIWACLSIDEGGEGVCAAPVGGMTLPLIAADRRRSPPPRNDHPHRAADRRHVSQACAPCKIHEARGR
jgi:hypothetical protein